MVMKKRINDPVQLDEVIVFVNGIRAETLQGIVWLWRKLWWIKRSVLKEDGCFEFKAGICSMREVIIVSYWRNAQALQSFLVSSNHKEMMTYARKNSSDLSLFNESYSPHKLGKYQGSALGLIKIDFSKVKEIIRDDT